MIMKNVVRISFIRGKFTINKYTIKNICTCSINNPNLCQFINKLPIKGR